jgi:cell division septum initiation protein DivIVA
LELRIKELQRLQQEEKTFLQQNEELSQEIAQAEKEETVIVNLLKMKSERGEKVKAQN